VYWLGSKRRKSDFADEMFCIICHDGRNMCTRIYQQATQLNRLVCSNASANTKNNVFASEQIH
jgi:siroheme synthase (precorrin-2 oxidase/ferrochelatase)